MNKKGVTKKRVSKKTLAAGSFVAVLAGSTLALIPGHDVSVTGVNTEKPVDAALAEAPERPEVRAISPLTGLPCKDVEQEPHRPIAVMLAGDDHVRPLSGIGEADLVVEMPVVTWGINRFMAVFSCGGTFDVGSIRSSRDDYIPLASGLGAVYGHWGGSYLALNQLRRGIIDNIDALQNPFGAYHRKPGILAPDNGFTTIETLYSVAEQLGYDTGPPEAFLRQTTQAPEDSFRAEVLAIDYFGPYAVRWEYDEASAKYRRIRGERPETDKNTGDQITAATIAVMRTKVTQAYGEYNDVTVQGSGEAIIFLFGRAVHGVWEKDEALDAPLIFKDAAGNIIPFAPGPVWIEIVQTDTPVTISQKSETSNGTDANL